MSSSNTSPAPWFADTGRNAVYDKRVWFDESGARLGDTPNLVVRIEGGRQADVHLIAAAPELLEACLAMIEWDDREKDHAVDFYKRTELCEIAFQKARAAITKATGENT